MVAYSFKPRFVEPIRAGIKRQTIRIPRKRPTVRGDALQLFTGPRMRPTKIGDAKCVGVIEVRLDFAKGAVDFGDGPGLYEAVAGAGSLDGFALADGFLDWNQMKQWWARTHPGKAVFLGVLIAWGETFRPA